MITSDPRTPARPAPRPADEARRLELASAWLARRDAGFSAEEQREFDAWLAADPRHAAAVAELSHAWALINRSRIAGRADQVLHALAARAASRRQRRVVASLTTATLAAAATLVLVLLPSRNPPPSPVTLEGKASTVTWKPERQTLPDGSVVELDSVAHIVTTFTASRRAVQLVQGEAHFTVARDVARPFVVSAGPVEVCAIGTQFAVRVAQKEIAVLVTEGRVTVAGQTAPVAPELTPPPRSEPIVVAAGGRVVVPVATRPDLPLRFEPVTHDQIAAALAWRGKRVEFTGTPLTEAVALFNRENRVQLRLGEQSLAGLRLSGVFWVDDAEGFARLIESSFAIRALRRSETEIAFYPTP